MANAFLTGLIAGRAEKQRRLNEERAQAAEQRTRQQFEQRQAGLEELAGEFGQRAFVPTEFGQLQGTVDRSKAAGQTFERIQGLIGDEQRDREVKTAATGLRLFDFVADKARQTGADPTEALQGVINRMNPQARALFGLEDPHNVQAMLMQSQDNPDFFKQQLEALVPPPVRTGSTAAPKTFEGTAVLSDGTERRVTLSRTADGTETIVGGLPPGLSIQKFTPDRPFAPQRTGSIVLQGVGGGGGVEGVADVTGALETAAQAEERGTQVGRFEGQTAAEDMQLSQTASNEIGRLVRGRRQGLENVTSVIDEAIAQTDWDSAGTIQGLKRVDGSTPANLAATLSTVQANATLDKLMEIKAAGATLGQVTERELELLRNSVAALEQSQSPAQLRANLERYKAQLQRTVAAIEADYQADIDRGRVRPMSGAPQRTRVSAADFLGGQ